MRWMRRHDSCNSSKRTATRAATSPSLRTIFVTDSWAYGSHGRSQRRSNACALARPASSLVTVPAPVKRSRTPSCGGQDQELARKDAEGRYSKDRERSHHEAPPDRGTECDESANVLHEL